MVDYEINHIIDSSQNCLIESNKKNIIFGKKEKTFKYLTKNLISKKRLLFLFIILYLNIQNCLCENPVIIIKIAKGQNSFIYRDFKNYLLEVKINDEIMENSITSYTFTEEENTVKLTLNSQINNFNKMFLDCRYIYEINFLNFDSSNINQFSEVFKNCNRLKSIDLSDWDISGVTEIKSLFENCNAMTSIRLPNFKNSNINTMNRVFCKCQKLASIDLSRIDTSQVTNMGNLFNECKELTSIDLSNFNTSNLVDTNNMFINCNKLTSLDLSKFDTSNLVYSYSMFQNCVQLTSLDLSNFYLPNLVNSYNMFNNCNKLKSLDISNFHTYNLVDCNRMFYNCNSLTSLDLSNFDTSNLVDCNNMFYTCNSLTSLNLSNFNTSKLQNVEAMFSGCRKIASLDLSNFDTSQITTMKDMFKNCDALTSLDISNFNTSSVTNMDRMFSHCSSITSLDLTFFDTSKVTDMYKMICDCFILVDLNISNFNTSSAKNMSHMFYSCRKLKSLDLSSFTMEGATNITYMFGDTPNLEYINLINSNPRENIIITNLFLGTSKNLVVCTDSGVISQQKNVSSCSVISCSETWRDDQKKIYSNQCFDNCSITNNKFDYLSNCVNECPRTTYIIEELSKCVDICPSSTYAFDNKCKQCHPDCKTCDGPYNDTYSNCTSCLSPDNYLENGNCISKYTNYYTTNEINMATTKDLIKEITTILIPDMTTYKEEVSTTNGIIGDETTEIIKDFTRDVSTNIIINKINDITTYIENIKLKNKDKYINIASVYNTTNNTMIYNIIKENLLPSFDPKKYSEIISEAADDEVFQITTSKNQLKALTNSSLNNYNLSILDISNCESILKEKYNLNENVDLIILKKEKISNKPSEKEVQLEIYEPYNKTKLNLSFCQDTSINIFVKAQLSDETKYSYEKLKSLGYDMFNINDPFYQDICTSYTSYGDTDIILSDRINYIYNNDDTKCQPNCKLSKYSEESEYLNCSCSINEEVNNMEQKFNSKKIYESFFDVLKYSNYKIIKCYNLVFTKYLVTRSIGGMIVFSFILVYLVCFIIFIIKGINPLKAKLELKVENKVNNNNINNINNNNIIINCKNDIYKDSNKYLNCSCSINEEVNNMNEKFNT